MPDARVGRFFASTTPAPFQEELRILREQIQSLKQATDLRHGTADSTAEATSLPVSSQPATTTKSSTGSALINALNPAVTVFGNFTGRLDSDGVVNEEGDAIDVRFNLR